MVIEVSPRSTNSFRTPVREERFRTRFDLSQPMTVFGGAGLLFRLYNQLGLRQKVAEALPSKAPWAVYSRADEILALLTTYVLGIQRVAHLADAGPDPLLLLGLEMERFPHVATLYRALERFHSEDDVQRLEQVHRQILARVLHGRKHVILDLDGTVEPIFGHQEGACVGYNPRYKGRRSYLPMLGFDGITRAALGTLFRGGKTPAASDWIAAYELCRAHLPSGVRVAAVRVDCGGASGALLDRLEAEHVYYAAKLKKTESLQLCFLRCSLMWQRISQPDDSHIIEVTETDYQAQGWRHPRRVVLIRQRMAQPEVQPALFAEYEWEYEAIVTNLKGRPKAIWMFYNRRCSAENYIKELKDGFSIGRIAKETFWPNAADLTLKAMAYNLVLALKRLAPPTYRRFSAERFRRTVLRLPGLLVKHARQWWLRLPGTWRHREAWLCIAQQLSLVPTG